MSDKKKPWLLDGEMYQYNLGWLIDKILSFETDLATAIDLKTIKYADPIQWDITTQYTANTVVIDPKTGTAYMSKVPVPSGIALDNTNYWVVIFNFLKIYSQIMEGIATNEDENDYASKDYLVNDLVWYSGVLYRVTRVITTGSKFIPGTNLVKTTIESCLESYYGKDRTAQVANDTLNVSGDYTINAGDIAETADNITTHALKSREIDVDGSDSVHIDGTSTLNVGGLRTEVYAENKTESVKGTLTQEFNSRSETASILNEKIATKTVNAETLKEIATDHTIQSKTLKIISDTALSIASKVLSVTEDALTFVGILAGVQARLGEMQAWVTSHRSNPLLTGTVLAVSKTGQIALDGFSKTSSNPNTSDMITMGVQGIAQSDDESKKHVVSWGGYFENRRIGDSSSAFGVEIDVTRQGTAPKTWRPYDSMSESDMCVDLNLSSGAGLSENSNGADSAIIVHANPQPFMNGIVFQNGCLPPNTPAIHLPWTVPVAWQLGDKDTESNQRVTGDAIWLANVGATNIRCTGYSNTDLAPAPDGVKIFEQDFYAGKTLKLGDVVVERLATGMQYTITVDTNRAVKINKYLLECKGLQLVIDTLNINAAAATGAHTDANKWLPIIVDGATYYIKLYS